jgi:hypothetical protein
MSKQCVVLSLDSSNKSLETIESIHASMNARPAGGGGGLAASFRSCLAVNARHFATSPPPPPPHLTNEQRSTADIWLLICNALAFCVCALCLVGGWVGGDGMLVGVSVCLFRHGVNSFNRHLTLARLARPPAHSKQFPHTHIDRPLPIARFRSFRSSSLVCVVVRWLSSSLPFIRWCVCLNFPFSFLSVFSECVCTKSSAHSHSS